MPLGPWGEGPVDLLASTGVPKVAGRGAGGSGNVLWETAGRPVFTSLNAELGLSAAEQHACGS